MLSFLFCSFLLFFFLLFYINLVIRSFLKKVCFMFLLFISKVICSIEELSLMLIQFVFFFFFTTSFIIISIFFIPCTLIKYRIQKSDRDATVVIEFHDIYIYKTSTSHILIIENQIFIKS